jgi:hypothetical protein
VCDIFRDAAALDTKEAGISEGAQLFSPGCCSLAGVRTCVASTEEAITVDVFVVSGAVVERGGVCAAGVASFTVSFPPVFSDESALSPSSPKAAISMAM